MEDGDFLSSILELFSILLKSPGVLRRGSARTENSNNFNRSTFRPETCMMDVELHSECSYIMAIHKPIVHRRLVDEKRNIHTEGVRYFCRIGR
jgi:hypothetical protein